MAYVKKRSGWGLIKIARRDQVLEFTYNGAIPNEFLGLNLHISKFRGFDRSVIGNACPKSSLDQENEAITSVSPLQRQ